MPSDAKVGFFGSLRCTRPRRSPPFRRLPLAGLRRAETPLSSAFKCQRMARSSLASGAGPRASLRLHTSARFIGLRADRFRPRCVAHERWGFQGAVAFRMDGVPLSAPLPLPLAVSGASRRLRRRAARRRAARGRRERVARLAGASIRGRLAAWRGGGGRPVAHSCRLVIVAHAQAGGERGAARAPGAPAGRRAAGCAITSTGASPCYERPIAGGVQ